MPSVFVAGVPAPQGNLTRNPSGAIYEREGRVTSWRPKIGQAVAEKCASPTSAAIGLALSFTFARPAGHFKKSGELRSSARPAMTTAPDVDKLARAVLDALTGVLYLDDRQVIALSATKSYGERPGVKVTWSEPT